MNTTDCKIFFKRNKKLLEIQNNLIKINRRTIISLFRKLKRIK